MVSYEISPVTLQQMQVFLSVAETLSFSHSAKQLNMTQPGISKSIVSLESLLGFSLFERTSRKVSLTEEGTLLYQKWKYALNMVQSGYMEALSVHDNRIRRLNVGVVNTADCARYFWNAAGAFQKAHPEILLNVEAEDMKVLENSLADDVYDVIFIPDFERYSVQLPGYQWKYAAKAPVQVIVPVNHPLTRKSMLTLEDIKDQPVTLIDPAVNPNFLHDLRELYRAIGAEPVVGEVYRSNFQIRFAQRTKTQIHITDDFWEYHETDFSKKIPLQGFENGIICVWKKGNGKKILKAFLERFPVEGKDL